MPQTKNKVAAPVADKPQKNKASKRVATKKAAPKAVHDNLRRVYQENGFIGSADHHRIDRPADRPVSPYRNHPGLVVAVIVLAIILIIALIYILLPFTGINSTTFGRQFLGNKEAVEEIASSQPQVTAPVAEEEPVDPLANWVTYNDASKVFEFKYSPAWKADQLDPERVDFSLSGLPETVITANWQVTSTDLNAYLSALDKTNATSWEGKPAVEVQRQGNVKIGALDAYQRWQKLLAADLEQIVTYIPVGDRIYSLAIRSPKLDDQMIQTYGLFLATFKANSVTASPTVTSSAPTSTPTKR